MEVELLKTPLAIGRLRADWERLFQARRHQPSTSFEWTSALLDHHIGPRDEPMLLVFRDDDQVFALQPLVRETHRFLGFPLVGLHALAERSGTHSDLLCQELDESMIESLIKNCHSITPGWDYMRYGRVLEDSDFDHALAGVTRRLGLLAHVKLEQPSFFLTLPDSFDKYLRERSGKFRNHLRRMERKLNARGRVRFWKLEAPDGFHEAYDALLSVELASWKHEHGTAISAIDHQRRFYCELAKGTLKADRLHLTLLELDGKPVAYNLGIVSAQQYFYLKTSFHEAFRQDGVATVSRARLLQMLIDEGVKEFDFPGEPYEWERQWTTEMRWHRSVLICNKTAMGRLYHSMTSLRDSLRKAGRKRKVEYCDPRSLKAPVDTRS
jgi:CelD/BcsL family acetyltransferase involved in cellulose biosynthesis